MRIRSFFTLVIHQIIMIMSIKVMQIKTNLMIMIINLMNDKCSFFTLAFHQTNDHEYQIDADKINLTTDIFKFITIT